MIRISIEAEPADLDAHLRALGFIRGPVGIGEQREVGKSPLLAAGYQHTGDFTADMRATAQIGTVTTSVDPSGKFAEPTLAKTDPDRQWGQPSPGRRQRTRDQIAEDAAYLKAHGSFPMAQPTSVAAVVQSNISTGEERRDPAADEQDAADEAAETAARRAESGGKATLEDLRAAVARMTEKHGTKFGIDNIRTIIGCALIEVPEDQIAAAISRVDHVTATGQIVVGVVGKTNGAAPEEKGSLFGEADKPKTEPNSETIRAATKDEVKEAILAYGKKYDGTDDMAKMIVVREDVPRLLKKLFGETCDSISAIPAEPAAYGRALAAVRAAHRDNPFKREVRA